MRLYRHGDVLITSVESIPERAKSRAGLVLAHGEVTGHAHRVETDSRAELFELDDDLFLSVLGSPARVVHEEHKPIELAPGRYRVWRQREYDPSTWERTVED